MFLNCPKRRLGGPLVAIQCPVTRPTIPWLWSCVSHAGRCSPTVALATHMPAPFCGASLPSHEDGSRMKPPLLSRDRNWGDTHAVSPKFLSLSLHGTWTNNLSPTMAWLPGCRTTSTEEHGSTFRDCPLPVLLLSSSSGTCSSPSPAPQSSVPLQRKA